MKKHDYLRMPSGSIVRVEDDRLCEVDHPNAIITNFLLTLLFGGLTAAIVAAALL